MMRTIEPSEAKLNSFISEPVDNKPILMVNLLRFREDAEDEPATVSGQRISGKEAYKQYGNRVIKLLWGVGGQILWTGKVRANFICPEEEVWHEFVLVYYPSRKAFIDMVNSTAYGSIVHHRSAALEDSRLIEVRPKRLPRAVLGLVRLFIFTKSTLISRFKND